MYILCILCRQELSNNWERPNKTSLCALMYIHTLHNVQHGSAKPDLILIWKKEFQFVGKKWTIFNRFGIFSYFGIPNLLPILFFIDRNLKGKTMHTSYAKYFQKEHKRI
jgi:hypothetical protein